MDKSADEVAKRARAAARAAWPVETFRLDSLPNDDLSASTTPEARLAMMWPLALEAWGLTGTPLPTYERRHGPVSVFRRSEGEKDPLAVGTPEDRADL